MHDLLMHPKTEARISQIILGQPNAVCILGPQGSGKQSLAAHIAARFLKVEANELAMHPYFLHINPEGDSISIDEIRALQQYLKLKVPSVNSEGINRVVIIEDSGRMRHEAQNALLKTLEEPPKDTCILMTIAGSEALLPTITSRMQELIVLPVSLKEAQSYFGKKGKKDNEIVKFYALSQGQAGLLHALLYDEAHPLLASVSLAKSVLGDTPARRLLRTDDLAKNKQDVRQLLNALLRITHAALVTAATQNKKDGVEEWRRRESLVVKAVGLISRNPNTKLLLDDLFLHL